MRPFMLLAIVAAASIADARPCTFYSAYGPGVYNLGQGGFDDTFVTKTRGAKIAGLRVGFRVDTEKSWDAKILGAYDQLLAHAYASGFDVIGLVGNEAVANAGQGTWNAPPSTSDGRNAYTQMFVDVTKVLFNRYGDQIKYWEIWNEPNACTSSDYLADCEANPTGAGGSFLRADLYAKLLAEVYVQNKDVIHAKGLHLVTGGLYAHDVGGNGVVYAADDYMDEVHGNGVWTWFAANMGRHYAWDAFGFHVYTTLYGGPVAASTVSAYYDRIAAERSKHGDASPIFVTEFGWQTSQISPAQQAQNFDTELSVLEGRGDIARTFVFRVSEWQSWGLYDASWNAKPAVAVFAKHAAGCQAVPLPTLPRDMAMPPAPVDMSVANDAALSDADASASDGDGGDGDGDVGVGAGGAPVGHHGCAFVAGGATAPWWSAIGLVIASLGRRINRGRRSCRRTWRRRLRT